MSKSQRYVVQTYTSWTEPQYETHIANSLKELKEISENSEKVEAVYLLGKEITYSKNKKSSISINSLKNPTRDPSLGNYKNPEERLLALL